MNDAAPAEQTASRTQAEADPIARARALVPLLQSAAAEIDATCELPATVLDAMHAAGMFRLLIPRAYGGAELDPLTYVQCVEQIAMGDASAAWCMNQGSGCSMSAAYVAPEVAREVWGGARDVLAWGQGPGARAVRVPGGWRVTGTWSFASGSRHATWLGAHCPCFAADGTPEHTKAGRPWERTMLIPRSQAKIEDVWDVMGLRGTGSDSYTFTDVFVDDAHTLTRDSAAERREPGLLYRFAAMQLYAAGFASVGLGLARATLDAFIALARKKTPALNTTALRDNAAIQGIVGHADARWKAARAGLHATLREVQANVAAAGELSAADRMAIRQAATFAIHEARQVVHDIYHEAGSTAIFAAQPFERRLRDMNAVSQQTQGRRSHLETVGHWMLGGEPNLRWV
ncbi:MAG: acyl-CoA dehydrogenase family protein [Rhodospirillales bacterium]|nr:acyl-CoA dehydrogenase family protein [Rhodospirillales bacterium]